MADDDTFIKWFNDDTQVGQLLAFLSNFSGTLQGLAAFASLFKTSDTDKILSAIAQLQQDLDRDFKELGDLIRQQIRLVVDTVNRDAMALALSRSDVASARIQDFLTNNDAAALETAKSESVGGVRFFTELGLTAPDLPFFMPGLIKAGTIRIFVIASEPLDVREPRAVIVDDVTAITTFLATMIDTAKRTVDAAHRVNLASHTVHCPPLQQVVVGSPPFRTVTVTDGFSHDETFTDDSGNQQSVRLAFFPVPQQPNKCEPQSEGDIRAASAAAQQARGQGVTDELAFIGIPSCDQILTSWRNLLTAS
jgi:hypothetical protein